MCFATRVMLVRNLFLCFYFFVKYWRNWSNFFLKSLVKFTSESIQVWCFIFWELICNWINTYIYKPIQIIYFYLCMFWCLSKKNWSIFSKFLNVYTYNFSLTFYDPFYWYHWLWSLVIKDIIKKLPVSFSNFSLIISDLLERIALFFSESLNYVIKLFLSSCCLSSTISLNIRTKFGVGVHSTYAGIQNNHDRSWTNFNICYSFK